MGILQWLGITGPVDPFEDYMREHEVVSEKAEKRAKELDRYEAKPGSVRLSLAVLGILMPSLYLR